MPLNIRCGQCRERITVDEGFAGGVCRCPHCSAIVPVIGKSDSSRRDRPSAPSPRPQIPDVIAHPEAERPARPEAPPSASEQPQHYSPVGQFQPPSLTPPSRITMPLAVSSPRPRPTAVRRVIFSAIVVLLILAIVAAVFLLVKAAVK